MTDPKRRAEGGDPLGATSLSCVDVDGLLAFERSDMAPDPEALAAHLASCRRCALEHADVAELYRPVEVATPTFECPPTALPWRPVAAGVVAAAVALAGWAWWPVAREGPATRPVPSRPPLLASSDRESVTIRTLVSRGQRVTVTETVHVRPAPLPSILRRARAGEFEHRRPDGSR